MSLTLQIRRAAITDLSAIVDFNYRLAEETEGLRLHRPDLEAGVAAVLADEQKGRYFVAVARGDNPGGDDLVGGGIVGQLMHTCEWSDWRNGDIWWLQSVYIHPDYRRRGVFRELFEHLRREAEADPSVVGIRLYVEEQNHRAQASYVGLGMELAGYRVMQKMLRRSDSSSAPPT